MTNEVTGHFDYIAQTYEQRVTIISKLYRRLKQSLIKNIVPPGKKILDYGCGTGEILNSLHSSHGIGYDSSTEMTKLAKSKFKKLHFVSSLTSIRTKFDYILMLDIIEHLQNLSGELTTVKKYMGADTKLVISYVDLFWKPLLDFLEAIKLKMPEGPHKRIDVKKILNLAAKSGLKLRRKGKSLLITYLIFER